MGRECRWQALALAALPRGYFQVPPDTSHALKIRMGVGVGAAIPAHLIVAFPKVQAYLESRRLCQPVLYLPDILSILAQVANPSVDAPSGRQTGIAAVEDATRDPIYAT